MDYGHQFYVVGNEWPEAKLSFYQILTFTSGAWVANPIGRRMFMAHILYFHGKEIKGKRKRGKCESCTSALLYSTIDLPEQEMASLVWEPDWEETPFSSSLFPTSLFVLCQLSNRVCSTLLTCKCAGSGFAFQGDLKDVIQLTLTQEKLLAHSFDRISKPLLSN